jgi:hypothetical protein
LTDHGLSSTVKDALALAPRESTMHVLDRSRPQVLPYPLSHELNVYSLALG